MRRIALMLSLVMIFMIPWENVVLIVGTGATGTRVVGFLVAAMWITAVVVTGKYRRPTMFHLAALVFVMWNAVSLFWSIDEDLTIVRLQTYLQLAVMVIVLWDLYSTPKTLRAGAQAYILGAYVAIISTVVNYRSGIGAEYSRHAATGFNPNVLGLVLALGIPIAWHLALNGDSGRGAKILRVINYAYLPAASLAILLTASRGALIAAVPAFFFVIWSLARFKLASRVLAFILLVGILFELQTLVPQSSIQRLATLGTSITEFDLGGRADIWRQGIEVFAEHPLFGIGSGGFQPAIELGLSAHNSFLSVLVEVGLIGLILFVAIITITIIQAARQPKWDARLWLTVLMVWILGSMSAGWEAMKPTWLLFSLIIASAAVMLRRAEPLQEGDGSVSHLARDPLSF